MTKGGVVLFAAMVMAVGGCSAATPPPTQPPASTPPATRQVVTPATGETFRLSTTTARVVNGYVITVSDFQGDGAQVSVLVQAGPEKARLGLGESHVFPGVGTITLLDAQYRARAAGTTGGGDEALLNLQSAGA